MPATETEFDARLKIETRLHDHETNLSACPRVRCPLRMSRHVSLTGARRSCPSENPGKTASRIRRPLGRPARSRVVGYDPFREVLERLLVALGQPPANAGTPTLGVAYRIPAGPDRWGAESRGPEIPPVPDGVPLHCVPPLTRCGSCVHSPTQIRPCAMAGFLCPGLTLGSPLQCGDADGSPAQQMCSLNWAAAAKAAPFHLSRHRQGLSGLQFDRYVEIEKGNPSTFSCFPLKAIPDGPTKVEHP